VTIERDAVFAAFRKATGRAADPADGPAAAVAAYAPGRVNLIGEHTDYNDGFVLPAAVDRGVAVVGRRVPGDTFTLHAADLGDRCTFALGALTRDPAHAWANYFKGVVWALGERGIDVPACEAVVTGDIPQGAGLSSSAAYEVATVLLLQALGGFALSTEEVAKLARAAENGFVGVACGIMDQMASAFGQKGRALLLDCRSLAKETVELPVGLKIVVVNSGVRHSLASSEYNKRRAECDEGVRVLSASLPNVRALRDVQPEDLARLLPALSPVVGKRCRHVVSENVRVHETIRAMATGDRAKLKRLLAQSHASLRDDYEVSCAELDVLVDLALPQSCCYGARLTGAGFGGSTVNLVAVESVADFAEAMTVGYRQRTGRTAEIHIFEPSAGAHLL
jgi:galactokinase